MKNLIRKSIVVTSLFIAGNIFIACNSSLKKENKKVAVIIEESNVDSLEKEVVTRNPIVFIAGYDSGNETFYQNARNYFSQQNFEVVEGQYSLEEIMNWLNNHKNDMSYGEIHIVNKSNPYKGLSLETIVKGDKVTTESLRRCITKGELPILSETINGNTTIVLHANGLGENTELMATFKDAFYADELPNVVASPYYSIFNGEFSNHYLAKAFYVFYPTAHSPGKVDLSKEIARKYPNEKDINWYEALNNEEERYIGEAYTTKFTIPVKFQLDYHNSDDEIPNFELVEEVMDFIEQNESLNTEMKQINIPLEKFRWTWSIKNSTLTIKGSTTGLTVLKPLIKPYGELEHIEPDTKNKRLYAMK